MELDLSNLVRIGSVGTVETTPRPLYDIYGVEGVSKEQLYKETLFNPTSF